MKDKILAALRLKWADKRQSEKTLSAVADALALTVTDEAGIDAAVEGIGPLLTMFQSEMGVAVTNALKEKPKPAEPPTPPTPPTPPIEPAQPGTPDNTEPPWAKKLFEQNQKLSEELSNLRQGKTTETRQQQLTAALKDAGSFKDLALKDFARIPFKDDDDFKVWLDEKVADSKNFVQAKADNALGIMGVPLPAQGPNGLAPASKEEVANVTKLFN